VGETGGVDAGLTELQLVIFGSLTTLKTGTGTARALTDPHCDCAAWLPST